MAREHSNSTSRVRRSEPGRRNSPASQTLDQARSAQEAADSPDSIKQLTEKLDALRRDIDDVEKQTQDEDEDFKTTKASLIDVRNEKKTALKEKEDASRDLRKEVSTLERVSAAAQARRTQQEKLLQQKENEREKIKDDVARWGRETAELRDAAERTENERAEYESASEQRIQALKDKYNEDIQTNKSLEEIIREKGTQIKSLEEERKNFEEGEDVGEAFDGSEPAEADEDRRWVATLTALQQRYAQAWTLFTEAERANQEAMSRLHYLQQRRLSQPQLFAGMPSQEPTPRRRNSQRSRPVSMREPLLPSIPGGFIPTSAAPFNSNSTSVSPPFQNATPYFNFNNGMALPHPTNNITSFSAAEIESLTGGAPMSPTAGALLPSGLFGDDTGLTDAEDDEDDPGPPMPILDPSPNMRHVLPGLGAPGTIEEVQSPSSPVSVQSRSPSLFASPRASAGQLGHYPAAENLGDTDKRSIRSTSSSFLNNPPITRFGGLFGLNRQRGKTLSDQGPPLGSLKPSQSQSLPRQDHAGLDPIGSQRRRGSHSGGAWYDSLKFGSKPQAPEPSSESPKHIATRKRGFNMFGSKGDPWLTSILGSERPSSPRQGSTKSGETNVLPRPSTESQTRFGWSVDAFGSRSSPLGVDWSMNNLQNTNSWSRMPSRRPSLQHGSTVSLIHDDLSQDDILPSNTRSPTQAPIGTRPQSSASHMPQIGAVSPTPATQLNPAAPVFMGIFGREKKSEEEKAEIQADKAKRAAEKAAEKEARKAEKEGKKAAKAEKSEKAKGKEKEKMLSTDSMVSDNGKDIHSPLDPRRSRDNRSVSTVDVSESSPRESLERSLSHTPSDSLHGSIGKESFLQKLSRKGSTSQFLSLGKGKTSLFSKKPSDAVTPDETEEDAGYLGRNMDSPAPSPAIGTSKDKGSSLGWSSFKRMSKRGDKTPSLHESIASETTGDEEDENVDAFIKV